jgi:hypothetical protein
MKALTTRRPGSVQNRSSFSHADQDILIYMFLPNPVIVTAELMSVNRTVDLGRPTGRCPANLAEPTGYGVSGKFGQTRRLYRMAPDDFVAGD